ncbi:hypothetical protein MET9862_05393 [Methylobacterium symbioticum]|uniref:Uncharacterized protein n=1 Tax=Methylobacterium symbioticum TaxID=2584084 RepID=A0A509EKQ5_9HYPH|nr:hypothetical protein MET9862_05393 [Methylobacterium symbioticum]
MCSARSRIRSKPREARHEDGARHHRGRRRAAPHRRAVRHGGLDQAADPGQPARLPRDRHGPGQDQGGGRRHPGRQRRPGPGRQGRARHRQGRHDLRERPGAQGHQHRGVQPPDGLDHGVGLARPGLHLLPQHREHGRRQPVPEEGRPADAADGPAHQRGLEGEACRRGGGDLLHLPPRQPGAGPCLVRRAEPDPRLHRPQQRADRSGCHAGHPALRLHGHRARPARLEAGGRGR